MTDNPALDWKRIPVVCLMCGKHSHKLIYTSDMIQYPYSPVDEAHVYVCATCKHPATVAADVPLNMPHISDPERSAHSRRKSSGLHTETWRVTR